MISISQRKLSCATTKLTHTAVNEDEWDTKKDTGKSMKNTLYVRQYASLKLKLLKKWRFKPVTLTVIKLHLSGQSISQSVNYSVG